MTNLSDTASVIAGIVGIPVTAGLVQIIKATEVIPTRFIPLVSVIIGTGLGGIAYAVVQDITLVVAGFMAGLGASGAYEATTKIMGKK